MGVSREIRVAFVCPSLECGGGRFAHQHVDACRFARSPGVFVHVVRCSRLALAGVPVLRLERSGVGG